MLNKYKYKIDSVAFHITYLCSHRCSFCYASDKKKTTPKHPPLEKLIRVVDELGIANVKNINLLGGDPSIYPHVIELSKYAVENYGIQVSILSNTLMFPNHSLSDVVKYISAFETTIHHAEPELHDRFCEAKGAYKNVINRIRKFSELRKKTGIAINITPRTSDNIFNLVNRVVNKEKVFLDYIIVQRIIPFGRAMNSSEFTLTRNQAERALLDIKRVDQELGLNITVEDPFPLCILPHDLRKYMNPCKWGFSIAAINPDGDLSRCGADPRYRLGNIFMQPLLEIWNNSEILESFRSRDYLPGRCRICENLEQCGGGCPLSCEIDKDHGIDYLYIEYSKLDHEIHGQLFFELAQQNELSSILQIEWGNFPGYGHLFSVESLKRWYLHNPKMFWVIRDSKNWVLGYSTIVPISKSLYQQIILGKYSSINEFPEDSVLKNESTEYFFIEVIATIPSKEASRAGSFLIKSVGDYLLKHATHVATSPITEIGLRLCKYFGFKQVANETYEKQLYPIFELKVNSDEILSKLKRF